MARWLAFILLLLPTISLGANKATHPSGWVKLDATQFSVWAPLGSRFVREQGVDSYVGEFVGTDFEIDFDYGLYSNDLKYRNGSTKLSIDGRDAYLVRGTGTCRTLHSEGSFMVGLFVPKVKLDFRHSLFPPGVIRLMLHGCARTQESAEVVRQILEQLAF